MIYYAHSLKDKPEEDWERLEVHHDNVGKRAAEFGLPFDADLMAYAEGVLHDIGKVDPDFKNRLYGENIRVDHSTAGAVLAIEKYGPVLGKMLAFCIAGHHAGLANGAVQGGGVTPLNDRVSNFNLPCIPPEMDLAPAFKDICSKIPMPMSVPGFSAEFSNPFFTRMLFSCLCDADFLETERFYQDAKGYVVDRGCEESLSHLSEYFERYLLSKISEAPKTPVNLLRAEVLTDAMQRAAERRGVFSLTVPTGGGKTLTSMAFSLRHAVANPEIRRIIYVIPFTSIIEQTADVMRDAIGCDEAILEHHSSFDTEKVFGDDEAGERKLRRDSQNWDRPIVITTAVQFFESLLSNRPSRCRKLHNIANSVIVLDEAQVMPLHLLRPCVEVLKELVRGYGCTLVLCTATQPALNARDGFQGGFTDVTEIASDPVDLNRQLKRVNVVIEKSIISDTVLAERLSVSPQVMCILNSKRHVRDVYNLIADQPGSRHLSTWMCAAHRRSVLSEIRQDLKDGKPVCLVSTSLIEAGVDIDFPEVWRSVAGMDSIAQAAGRCNREGKLECGTVHVFIPEAVNGRKFGHDMQHFADAAMKVLEKHSGNPINLDAIREYFKDVYWTRGEDLDGAMVGEPPVKGILRALRANSESGDYPFADIAKAFRMIETRDIPLIVPYGNFQDVVDELETAETLGGVSRRLQQFIVQVPPAIRQKLVDDGHAEIIREGDFKRQFVFLTNSEMYDDSVGLMI